MRLQPRSILITGSLAAALVLPPSAIAQGNGGGPPEHAQGNGPPPQAQGNDPPPQSQGNGPSSNENGANQSPGPYTPPTSGPGAPGNPSGNGGGNDANSGNRPAAGTVGNADEKNPPGQYPGGSDSNNGYECDGNSGVGKMNPAHSGCGPGSTSNPPPDGKNPPPDGKNPPPDGNNPPPGPSGNPPTQQGNAPSGDVLGESETSPPEEEAVANPTPVSAQPEAAPRPPDERALPFTGSEPFALLLLGLVTLFVGLGLSRALRPRSLD